jgi:hypothetical protein
MICGHKKLAESEVSRRFAAGYAQHPELLNKNPGGGISGVLT